jgi:hypothetical protein
MAQDLPQTTERERVQGRDLNNPLHAETDADSAGVHVYDRPAGARTGGNNTLTMILALLVILILAYFLFQWLL